MTRQEQMRYGAAVAIFIIIAACTSASLGVAAATPSTVGDGRIIVTGSQLSPNVTLGVGVYGTGFVHKVGTVTTDATGAIASVALEYSCASPMQTATRAGVFINGSGTASLGAGVLQTTISGQTCVGGTPTTIKVGGGHKK